MAKVNEHLGHREISTVTSDDLLQFLSKNTEGQKPATKRLKYTLLKSLFNFIGFNTDIHFHNPCDAKVLKVAFRAPRGRHWRILEKDVVDEMIFKTANPRSRLMLELMARGGMRVSEVLKLRVITFREAASGEVMHASAFRRL